MRLKIEPQNGWQIYSHQPGDVGLPTDVKWNLYDHRLVSEQWSEGEDVIYEGFGLNVYRKPAWYTAMLGKSGRGNARPGNFVDGLQGGNVYRKV